MLQALNTKLLIAILALLTGIGSWLVYQQHQAAQATAAAQKAAQQAAAAAALLQQQHDSQAEQDREYQRLRKAVEDGKRNQGFGNESKTWQKALP